MFHENALCNRIVYLLHVLFLLITTWIKRDKWDSVYSKHLLYGLQMLLVCSQFLKVSSRSIREKNSMFLTFHMWRMSKISKTKKPIALCFIFLWHCEMQKTGKEVNLWEEAFLLSWRNRSEVCHVDNARVTWQRAAGEVNIQEYLIGNTKYIYIELVIWMIQTVEYFSAKTNYFIREPWNLFFNCTKI